MAQDPVPYASGGAPSDVEESSRSLFRMIWRRKALVAFGAALGLVIGGLLYTQRTPVYQASAQVLVVKKHSDPLPVNNGDVRMSFVEDYVSTHLVVIRSQAVVQAAVKTYKLGSLPSFAGQGDPTGTIIASLSATRDSKDAAGGPNNVINLSYRGPVAEDCKVVLDAVLQSYQTFLDEAYFDVNKQTIDLITTVQGPLKKELEASTKAYQKFRETSPLLFKGKDGINVSQERVAELEAKESALRVRQVELEEQRATIDEATEQGHGRAAVLGLMTNAARDAKGPAPQTNSEERLLPLLLQEQQLLRDYGEDHPAVGAIRDQMKLIRQVTKPAPPPGGAAASRAAEADEAAMADPVARYLESLRQELEVTKRLRASVQEMLAAEKDEARAVSRYELQDEQLRGEITRVGDLYRATVKRFDEIKLGKDAGGFNARTLAEPGPGSKIAPILAQFLGAGLLFGLLAGAGLAYWADWADQGFRTPEEIRRRLGLPVLGHIPLLTADEGALAQAAAGAAVLDPLVRAHYHPRSVDAESYRSVRTALYFSAQGGGCHVIQVTSPHMGDGKSTLVLNLAVSIAQSGKRILVIDADLRRPRLHKAFGVSGATGLASVIAGQAEPTDAIQETIVPGVSLLPAGPVPPNPAELLTSPRFKELIDLLRPRYDFVLIDTPPLLAVTDPCVVAPRVDGVLLTIRLSKQAGPQALRSKEILGALGVRLLGVVVNGIGRHDGASGYGGGRYEYAYSEDSYETDEAGPGYFEGGEPDGTAVGNGHANGHPPASGGRAPSKRRRPGPLSRFFARWS